MAVITIKDAGNVDRDVNVKLRGTTYTQVLELETVTSYKNINLNETGVSIIGSTAILHSWEIFNRQAAPIYVKVYNKATLPTSADTPVRVWEIAPGQAFPFSGEVLHGIALTLGLGLRCTGGLADNDTTAVATNACVINIGYRPGV